jgi:hypothetical protein
MTTLEMLNEVSPELHGMITTSKQGRKIVYTELHDELPEPIRNSLTIQYIEEDRRLLREAMIPFIHSKNNSTHAEDYTLDIYL